MLVLLVGGIYEYNIKNNNKTKKKEEGNDLTNIIILLIIKINIIIHLHHSSVYFLISHKC
jgi:hypothetical protein